MKVNPGDLVRMKGRRDCFIVLRTPAEDTVEVRRVGPVEDEEVTWFHQSSVEQVIASAVCEPPEATIDEMLDKLRGVLETIQEVRAWAERRR